MECWRRDSGRMPCGSWQECALWLNIPVSHPVIGRLLATRGNELTVDHLTGRMRLFENSIPLLVLLWESFYTHMHSILTPPPHTHTPFVRLCQIDSPQQLLSFCILSTGVLSSDWLLLICGWINGERRSHLQMSFRPPRPFYLWWYGEVRGRLFILSKERHPLFLT